MNAKKRKARGQHPRMKNVFEERNTKQSQTLMELWPNDLENAVDWYAWCLYWDIEPLYVKKLHTFVKDLDDKLDEKEAVVSIILEELGKHSQLVESRSNNTSVISKTSSARRVLCLKVKALKKQKEQQATLEKLKHEAIQREIADLYEEIARRARIPEKETELAKVSRSCGTSFQSVYQTRVSRKTQDVWTSQKQPKTGLSPLLLYQFIRRQRMQ